MNRHYDITIIGSGPAGLSARTAERWKRRKR